MKEMTPFPFFIRFPVALFSIGLVILFIYIAQSIFIPVILALMFAILLQPLVGLMKGKLRFPLILAVSVSVLFALLVLSGILYFISLKVGEITNDWEKIEANLIENYHHLQRWIEMKYRVSFIDQNNYLEGIFEDATAEGKYLIGSTINSFTGTMINFILIPFYVFLILVYRNLFIVFLLKLFHSQPGKRIYHVLSQIKMAVQSFLVGTLIEMGIVSSLSAIGLMIIGLKYAILVGLITGILNLIPYIGILIATLLTLIATLTDTAGISTILAVLILNVSIHILDANVLIPMVVSRNVKINAFISILLIVTGSHLAGVAGMFLAIPMAAIMKIIFDEVDELKPWGFLLGDNVPKSGEWNLGENSPTVESENTATTEPEG